MKALIKPQYVDQIPKAVKGTVQQLLDKKDERNNQETICDLLGNFCFFNSKLSMNKLIHIVEPLYNAYTGSRKSVISGKG